MSTARASASSSERPARKLKAIRLCLLAYVLLTGYQVHARREDFPLSGFPMFSGLHAWGATVQRTVLKGVSDQGERVLHPTALSELMSAPRLRQMFNRIRKAPPAEQARFVDSVAALLKDDTDGPDKLWGLRFYREGWRVQPQLLGLENPMHRLDFVEFLPPRALLAELRTGARPAPLPLPAGDWLGEPDARACGVRCAALEDAGASAGRAVRLRPWKGAEAAALTLVIPPGAAKLFVRMRTPAASGEDVLTVSLDGQVPWANGPPGLGNYKQDLPFDGWVWASVAPAWPALALDASPSAPRQLVLKAERGVVDIDQVWLARTRPEPPVSTAPVEAAR